jgi:hypothetical protein
MAYRLEAVRAFVLWWDAQEKHPGARFGTAVTEQSRPIAGENGLPERKRIERWRDKTKDPSSYGGTRRTMRQVACHTTRLPVVVLPQVAKLPGKMGFQAATRSGAGAIIIERIVTRGLANAPDRAQSRKYYQ